MWSKNNAVSYLKSHAQPGSTNNCAKYVRLAIQAGGVNVPHTLSAKDYGAKLEIVGFQAVPATTPLQPGDVAIIQPIPGHPHGHMAMYDGKIWISDFRQLHGFYPGQSYRAIRPPYQFYRHP